MSILNGFSKYLPNICEAMTKQDDILIHFYSVTSIISVTPIHRQDPGKPIAYPLTLQGE